MLLSKYNNLIKISNTYFLTQIGGNEVVQRKMLCHLQEKHDTKFFTSLSSLMQLCNVLDLDAYERSIKAETLGSSQVQLEEAENKGIV